MIKDLQLKLISEGYLDSSKDRYGNYIEADGIYGPKTRTAYQNYVKAGNSYFQTPQSEYTIQPGDNLGKIAKQYNISVDDILQLNKIDNPNIIYTGQKIKLFKNPKKVLLSSEDIQNREAEINKQSNKQIINYYHQTHQTNTPYIIDDKINNTLGIYYNGHLIKQYPAIHGKYSNSFGQTYQRKIVENGATRYEATEVNPDEMTVTYVKPGSQEIDNLKGNLTTPAGIYYSSPTTYHGVPSFMRRTKDQVEKKSKDGIPSSIHVRTITEGANTNGCTGMDANDLNDMSIRLQGFDNIPTYILPVDSRNKFKIRNGNLSFSSHDVTKTPSHYTINTDPIKNIRLNLKDLDQHQKQVISQFALGLIKYKKNIQDILKINNDTYNKLAKAAIGILGVESNYGRQNSAIGNFFRAASKFISKNNSSPDIYSKYETYGATDDNNSIGLTQIRYSNLSEKTKKLLTQFGITKDDLVNNPQKAAVATMLKLASEYMNTGQNINKAIQSWNKRGNYLDRVLKASQRATINQDYMVLNRNGGKFPIFKLF